MQTLKLSIDEFTLIYDDIQTFVVALNKGGIVVGDIIEVIEIYLATGLPTGRTLQVKVTSIYQAWAAFGMLSKLIVFSFVKVVVPPDIPTVLYDGNTFAWLNYSDSSFMSLDGTNHVISWADFLGSGNTFSAPAENNRPSLEANGVYFDGVNFPKQLTFFAPLDNPVFVYMLVNVVTYTSYDTLLESTAPVPNASIFLTGPNLALLGYSSYLSQGFQLNEFCVIRALVNGASSKFVVNDSVPTTGDLGSYVWNGFSIGCSEAVIYASDMLLKHLIIRTSTAGEDDIFNYLFSMI